MEKRKKKIFYFHAIPAVCTWTTWTASPANWNDCIYTHTRNMNIHVYFRLLWSKQILNLWSVTTGWFLRFSCVSCFSVLYWQTEWTSPVSYTIAWKLCITWNSKHTVSEKKPQNNHDLFLGISKWNWKMKAICLTEKVVDVYRSHNVKTTWLINSISTMLCGK